MRVKLIGLLVIVFCMVFGTVWGITTEKSGLIYYPTNGTLLIAINEVVESRGYPATIKLTNPGSGVSYPYILTSGVTFSDLITLEFEEGAMLTTNSGVTTILNCAIVADFYQRIFSGSGAIRGTLPVNPLSPFWFGATCDGSTDDTLALQAVLDIAKGVNDTGIGRAAGSTYWPLVGGGFYKITDSLVIDGTYGLHIYSDSALTQREDSTRGQGGVLRWYGSSSLPVIQIRGETSVNSNPNFQIKISDLTISGTSNYYSGGDTIPTSTAALAGVYIGNIDDITSATLNRNILIENVSARNCRFGLYSGSPELANTDHALIKINDCIFTHNFQAGIWWGGANAIGAVNNCTVGSNGWGSASYSLDDYTEKQAGANIYVTAGQLDIVNYTSSGVSPNQPTDADIYQNSGKVSVTNAWSDTHGPFLYQNSALFAGAISSVRHYEGSMSASNTPVSMLIKQPGTTVSSSLVFGNIECNTGLGTSPIFSGIEFFSGSTGTFTGTGVDTQRSIIDLGHIDNYAQIFLGGAEAGVTLEHRGDLEPQLLSMGTSSAGFGTKEAILQAIGSHTGDSSFTQYLTASDGSISFLTNCYVSGVSYYPENTSAACWRIDLGGQNRGFRFRVYDPNGSSTSFVSGDWVEAGQLKLGAANGSREEVALFPPQRSSNPSFTSGDTWEGGIYYNTTDNTLRLNVGGSTWETIAVVP